ncbi:hypothetical protein BJP39_27220 [Streptomyces sp. CC77]|nr:hypothetical protein BJP39_27220 [Streptomyces sp. CC77]
MTEQPTSHEGRQPLAARPQERTRPRREAHDTAEAPGAQAPPALPAAQSQDEGSPALPSQNQRSPEGRQAAAARAAAQAGRGSRRGGRHGARTGAGVGGAAGPARTAPAGERYRHRRRRRWTGRRRRPVPDTRRRTGPSPGPKTDRRPPRAAVPAPGRARRP